MPKVITSRLIVCTSPKVNDHTIKPPTLYQHIAPANS